MIAVVLVEITNKPICNNNRKEFFIPETEDYSSGDTDSKALNCVPPDYKMEEVYKGKTHKITLALCQEW